MPESNAALERIINHFGGPTALAKRMGVAEPTVFNWYRIGISLRFWPFFLYCGFTLEDLYATHLHKLDKEAKKVGVDK